MYSSYNIIYKIFPSFDIFQGKSQSENNVFLPGLWYKPIRNFLRIRSQLKGSFETKKDSLYVVVGGKGNKKSSPRGFPDICTLNGKSRYCYST